MMFLRRRHPVNSVDVTGRKETMGENTTELVGRIIRKRVIVFIDETNTGGIDQGPEYVVGAIVLEDSFFEYRKAMFEEITRKRFRALPEDLQKDIEELKFTNAQKLRKEILIDVSKLNPNLYAATVIKPKDVPWTRNQQRDVHRNAVLRLMKEISKNEQGKDIDLTIDEVDKLGFGTLNDMKELIAETHRGELIFRIDNSRKNFGLQTNDFNVGAMGKRYNRGEEEWVKYLRTEITQIPLSQEEALKDTAKRSPRKSKKI